MRIFRTAIISILLLLTIHMGVVYAVEYFSIGGKPANPDPNIPNSVSWFIYNLDLGESKEDELTVLNTFDRELELLVYAADGLKSSSGGFAVRQYVEPKNAIGAWVKFYPDPVPEIFTELFTQYQESILNFCAIQLDESWDEESKKIFSEWCEGKEEVKFLLDARSKRNIRFVFSVPKDASVGEHTGGIVIQKVEPEATNTQTGITLTTRVGIRIYQTVPGDIVKEVKIKKFSLQKLFKELEFERLLGKVEKPEEILITTEIENIGNVSIEFNENISIKQDFPRKSEEIIKDRKFQVLRDDTFISNYSWYNPRIGKFQIQNTITFTDDETEKSMSSDVITLWIIPWREIIAGGAILAIFLFFFAIFKIIAKKKYGGKGWSEYVVQVGETLEDLSNRFDVDWKKLAKTNKIKPPYILKPGQTILVPKKE